MLPTPRTDSVDYDLVYEPAEDSFLLLDLLEVDKDWLSARFASILPVVLEIGTGSGIVTTFMHNNIIKEGLFYTTDLNIHACEASLSTSKANGGTKFLDTLRASLASPFRRNLVDILVFNPPYVPNEAVPTIPQDDDASNWLDLALEGGKDGMEVTNILLNGLDAILSKEGIAYILFCKRNNPEQVVDSMRNKGWTVTIVGERRAGWEVLSVIKFERT